METKSVEDLLKRKKVLETNLSKMREQQAVAAASLDRLKKELTDALESLKEDFGVSTFDEATKKFEDMKLELEQGIEKAEEQLREVRSN